MGILKNLLMTTAGAAVMAWGTVGLAQTATAASLTGNYFKVPAASDPDFGKGIDGSTVTGLVSSTLGPDGLPVVSTKGSTYSGPSGAITDVNSKGEILWWSTTSTHGITAEKTQIDQLPFNFNNFYPDGQTGDSNFFRTVHWSGSFNLASAGTANFTLGSDDDAFLFVDNQLKVDDGGVKANSPVSNAVSGLSAGPHKFDLFFADRHGTGSGISFSADVTLTPVPEPSFFLGPLVFGALGASSLLRLNLSAKNRSQALKAQG